MKPLLSIRRVFFLFIIFGIFVLACKKHKDDAPTPGTPSHLDTIPLKKAFSANSDIVNFQDSSKVFFKTAFADTVSWRIVITGQTSFATKTIEGTSSSIDSLNSLWNGSQDSLYYFLCGETCFVRVYEVPAPSTLILLAQDTISISPCTGLAKPIPSYVLDLFPSTEDYLYVVGYDDENRLSNGIQTDDELEYDHTIIQNSGNALQNMYTLFFDTPLAFAKGGKAIRGGKYALLKGKDTTQICNASNYYIGRVATNPLNVRLVSVRQSLSHALYSKQLSTIKELNASKLEDVYFNVFVYGTGDGSKMLIDIKEDDNLDGEYSDRDDEFYQAQITLDFTGWKLFSFNYGGIDFSYQAPLVGIGCNSFEFYPGKYANQTKEPNNIIMVQFSLAAKDLGGTGQLIVDYPTFTLGKPLDY